MLRAADEFPELRTLDGKLYKQVKVTKTSPAEIRVMHADGFAIIPLSQLPPEIRARYGQTSKNAEMIAEAERELNNIRARPAAIPAPSTPQAQQQAMRMDEYIAAAIANRKILMIAYDNGAEGPRLVEPHLLGVTTAGHWALSGWFREGASQSAKGEGWRTYLLEKITAMEMVEQTFDGARPGYDAEGGGLYQTLSARLPVGQNGQTRQQLQAQQYQAVTGQPYDLCLQAVMTYEWCAANPQGGVVNGVSYNQQARDEQLRLAMNVLNSRPAAPAVAAPVAVGRGVIESSIDGEFTGFEGEKVFKLLNGQVWQQSDFYYHYRYAYGPRVMIYQGNGGWMMKVDGVERAVRVLLLK